MTDKQFHADFRRAVKAQKEDEIIASMGDTITYRFEPQEMSPQAVFQRAALTGEPVFIHQWWDGEQLHQEYAAGVLRPTSDVKSND